VPPLGPAKPEAWEEPALLSFERNSEGLRLSTFWQKIPGDIKAASFRGPKKILGTTLRHPFLSGTMVHKQLAQDFTGASGPWE
jgi:hypothetical protein